MIRALALAFALVIGCSSAEQAQIPLEIVAGGGSAGATVISQGGRVAFSGGAGTSSGVGGGSSSAGADSEGGDPGQAGEGPTAGASPAGGGELSSAGAGLGGGGASSAGGGASGGEPSAGAGLGGGGANSAGATSSGGSPGHGPCPYHTTVEGISASAGHSVTISFPATVYVEAVDLAPFAGYTLTPIADGVQISKAFLGGALWQVPSNNRMKSLVLKITPYTASPLVPAGGLALFCM